MTIVADILAAEQAESLWTLALAGVLIFILRVVEMSLDGLRVISLIRGRRVRAGLLGFCEAGLFIFAISRVLMPPIEWPKMLGYAAGFGTGTYMGSRLAATFSTDFLLVRVLSKAKFEGIRHALRNRGFGVTTIEGHGRDGPVIILFCVAKRKQGKAVLDIVRKEDPKALVVAEPLDAAVNAFVPRIARTTTTGARR